MTIEPEMTEAEADMTEDRPETPAGVKREGVIEPDAPMEPDEDTQGEQEPGDFTGAAASEATDDDEA